MRFAMYFTPKADHGNPILHDPAAKNRATGMLVAILLIWPLLVASNFDPTKLLDLRNLQTIGGFLSGFLPPEVSGDFLGYLLKATLETVAIATAGVALAFLLAAPLAIASTHSLSISRIGPHGGRWRREILRFGIRNILVILRGIPVLVWALVFVRVFGLGPTAGVLAIGLTYGGMLAKVYAEIFESGDTRPVRAILESGGGRLQALLYGLLPCSAQELTSYTVYRWECAIRTSVVMGFVGAGGLGQLMDQAMKMLNGGEAATILLMFFLLVIGADLLSAFLRKRVGNAGTSGHISAVRPASIGLLTLLSISIIASFIYLDLAACRT
jgi:phosphonate transport system permease protein